MKKSAIGLVLAGAVLAPLSAQAETTITVTSFGGGYQEAQKKAYFDAFTAAQSEIAIREDSPTSNAKLKAMVEAGAVDWDLVLTDDSFGLETDAAWLEPIDYTIVNRDKFIDGTTGTYRVAADIEATVLAYNSAEFGDAKPEGFEDFFNTEDFPGLRAAWKYAASGLFETALLADGVAAEDLYPIDVERALAKLDTIKEDLIWWETGAQSEQLLTSGEAAMGLVWVSRALSGADKGVRIDWTDWTSQTGYWVVPKGTKNKEAAMRALEFFTEPAQQIAFTEFMPYGPSNKHAVGSVLPNFAGNLPTDHLDSRVLMDAEWWGVNGAAVDARFQEWLLQ
ncbi:ABC transporter substrate-binding protein [Pseudogemmobacter faecipullorum]|uniref:ABC transporter substrate-binding protein n=1 Tax=Pseudogemmobacter faecipullorum TaxID=2755041 RepID=A0ABS8CMU9_9RHOB|nr:ABC transporter substrate-binding protein [Pseudogemmobacter faecipullorum]MCB5410722.1 ABC transporter substrate-binding protein [Pseudogemmobacter faecipullorum]